MPFDAIMLIVICSAMVIGIFYYEHRLRKSRAGRTKITNLGNRNY